MAIISNNIKEAAARLEKGEVIGIPTETVYGLAANALNAAAVAKIFEIKGRPRFDPLIVHVATISDVENYAMDFPEHARLLTEKFWPGPLTLLLPKKKSIPDLVTSGLDTVGLRCPDHATTKSLLQQLAFPLAAPSANPFGYVSPTTAQHVQDQLGDHIPFILDGGPCQVGLESTIVGFDGGTTVIHRLGGLPIEEIESAVGKVRFNLNSSSNPIAPGQLSSHYAPKKKMLVGNLQQLMEEHKGKRIGILSFKKRFQNAHSFVLAPTGSLNEAAQNIFSALRELDRADIDLIVAEFVPDVGLGKAINDRLRRACFE
jgi:L-threonylcarbamoyladenylate synthase